MASFDVLPPEILLLVARSLGSPYLGLSPESLLICKAWFVSSSELPDLNAD